MRRGDRGAPARGALETARTGNAFSQILPENRIAGGNPALVAACQTTALACTNGSPPCEISSWVTARWGCVWARILSENSPGAPLRACATYFRPTVCVQPDGRRSTMKPRSGQVRVAPVTSPSPESAELFQTE